MQNKQEGSATQESGPIFCQQICWERKWERESQLNSVLQKRNTFIIAHYLLKKKDRYTIQEENERKKTI